MPKEYPRTRRVAEQLQRELAELISKEIGDPHIGMVTLAGVEVSRDLRHARVYVTVLGEPGDVEATLGALNKAAGYLRRRLGQRLRLRTVPELRFLFDASVEEGFRLDTLIDEAVADDRARAQRRTHGDGPADEEDG
ncbi:MAG: 30S ribosome-binding factor RbfA [Gammaproteobacteria bacterium]|nr:30S ribosome-binding factor RbfA [Gammaproteobacteria bacterium]NIR82312.1 30S ribosome-binding factor RbfA [Gammaproteobacteria bacterium]NIU03461.1 30S ribosome-binding factor RbfA [Gammaproteobacteria bacterium]NIX84736.1 30S ribosome-binding factor RbfA [Gammaproteobacteria bacterium]